MLYIFETSINNNITFPYFIDYFSVHFGGGTWGVIALAFFHKQDGILFNWNEKSGYVSKHLPFLYVV